MEIFSLWEIISLSERFSLFNKFYTALPSRKHYSKIYIYIYMSLMYNNRRVICRVFPTIFRQPSEVVSLFVARSDEGKNSPSRVQGVWSLRDQGTRQARVFYGGWKWTASRKRWGCKLLTSRLIYEIVPQKRHADCFPNSYMFHKPFPRPFSLPLSLRPWIPLLPRFMQN